MDLGAAGILDYEILLTHFHMDHLFGFPFFAPLYNPNSKINITMHADDSDAARERLNTYLNGVYHPLQLQEVPSRLTFQGISPGKAFERGPFQICGISLNHPGGACGYRIQHKDKVVLFLTDTAPYSMPNEGVSADKLPDENERRLIKAMTEADLVIMDTMFSFEEYLQKITWGHAYPEYAYRMCELAGVERLALFHHAPTSTDDDLDELGRYWQQKAESSLVFVAKEGETVDLSE